MLALANSLINTSGSFLPSLGHRTTKVYSGRRSQHCYEIKCPSLARNSVLGSDESGCGRIVDNPEVTIGPRGIRQGFAILCSEIGLLKKTRDIASPPLICSTISAKETRCPNHRFLNRR